jgi:Fe2+ transport system protein FeoA
MHLSEIRPGQRGRVVRVEGEGPLRHRLIEMGILPDQVVSVERIGPLGDPFWIRMANFQFALRGPEARLVIVTPTD